MDLKRFKKVSIFADLMIQMNGFKREALASCFVLNLSKHKKANARKSARKQSSKNGKEKKAKIETNQ